MVICHNGPSVYSNVQAFTVYLRIIPESASWLVVKGRIDEAVSQYKLVARINNREFKEEEVTKALIKERELDSREKEKASIIQLFKTPNLRINALLVNVIW